MTYLIAVVVVVIPCLFLGWAYGDADVLWGGFGILVSLRLCLSAIEG